MNNKAFTLIETLIAITIVTITVAGPLYSASRAIVAADLASQQLTATYLAQEGIEYVRAMRDDAYLYAYKNPPIPPGTVSTAAWNDFTAGSSAWSITNCRLLACTLDPTQVNMGHTVGLSLQQCGGGSGVACSPLHKAGNGLYVQENVGTVTPYTRILQVNVQGNEAVASSTVAWNFHGTAYSATIIDHLTPWQ